MPKIEAGSSFCIGCCAPCATHCIACVEQKLDTTLYFYNPNIMMREEYEKRLSSFAVRA